MFSLGCKIQRLSARSRFAFPAIVRAGSARTTPVGLNIDQNPLVRRDVGDCAHRTEGSNGVSSSTRPHAPRNCFPL